MAGELSVREWSSIQEDWVGPFNFSVMDRREMSWTNRNEQGNEVKEEEFTRAGRFALYDYCASAVREGWRFVRAAPLFGQLACMVSLIG